MRITVRGLFGNLCVFDYFRLIYGTFLSCLMACLGSETGQTMALSARLCVLARPTFVSGDSICTQQEALSVIALCILARPLAVDIYIKG